MKMKRFLNFQVFLSLDYFILVIHKWTETLLLFFLTYVTKEQKGRVNFFRFLSIPHPRYCRKYIVAYVVVRNTLCCSRTYIFLLVASWNESLQGIWGYTKQCWCNRDICNHRWNLTFRLCNYWRDTDKTGL